MGLGLGLVFAPAMNTATVGVEPPTPASRPRRSTRCSRSAARSAPRCCPRSRPPRRRAIAPARRARPAAIAQATMSSYTTAFWWSAGSSRRRDRVRRAAAARRRDGGGGGGGANGGGGCVSTVVTISASYGAGGSWVGPHVAEQLGCRFIDRAIPVQVAERLAVPVAHAEAHDETAAPRFTRLLARLPNTSGVVVPKATKAEFCRETERPCSRPPTKEMWSCSDAPPRLCRRPPEAFHVRLDGPEERACSRRCGSSRSTGRGPAPATQL